MSSQKLMRSIAAGAAAVALAIGAYAIANPASSSSARSGISTAAPTAQSQATQTGRVPQGWRPGTGTIIAGAAADKAKAAAVAKYPGGTVNRVLQLSDGSYAVHRIGITAHHHVFVSKDFKVTGTS